MNRLLSLVAMGAVVPLLGLYALLIKMSIPVREGGMEPTMSMVCYIAFTVLIGAFIIIALNFSRQLSRQAKGEFTTP